MEQKTKHICMYGGPGVGKSTTSAGLFYELKSRGIKSEYATEVAKDFVYSKKFFELSDQLMVLARSHHNWYKLEGVVDFAVHDGPFLIGNAYVQENGYLPVELFKSLTVELYNNYDTVNILLQRDLDEHPYQEYGRTQTLDQAIELDTKLEQVLIESGVKYHKVKSGVDAPSTILDIIGVQ